MIRPVRPMLRDAGVLLLLALLPALLSAWLHPNRPAWSWHPPAVAEVDLRTVQQWHAVLWVDARGAKDYSQQHIPGAISLNETEWERLLPEFLLAWQPGRPVVVYCNSEQCNASHEVAARLKRELNIGNIRVLKGGWAAWQEAHP